MLNLSEIKKKNYELIWFDGSTLQLKRPSQKLLTQLMSISKMDEQDLEGIMNLIYDVLFTVFNNNINGRKFKREEIEDNFDLATAYTFIEDYMGSVFKQLGEL